MIISASKSGANTTIKGTAWNGADPVTSVEVYKSIAGSGDGTAPGFGEGLQYLGTATVSGGTWSITVTGLNVGDLVSAIGITAAKNTSEFGANYAVTLNTAPVAVNDTYSTNEDTSLSVTGGQWDVAMLNWQYRSTLTVNSIAAGTQTDFPVLVTISAAQAAQMQAAGQDLRFVDADGTLLAYEIESWNPGGTSYAWVKVPQLDTVSGADFIRMYWGNAGAVDAQNAAGVWSNGYNGVWHLNNNVQDSTGTNTAVNNGTTALAGEIAQGQDFNGTGNYVDLQHHAENGGHLHHRNVVQRGCDGLHAYAPVGRNEQRKWIWRPYGVGDEPGNAHCHGVGHCRRRDKLGLPVLLPRRYRRADRCRGHPDFDAIHRHRRLALCLSGGEQYVRCTHRDHVSRRSCGGNGYGNSGPYQSNGMGHAAAVWYAWPSDPLLRRHARSNRNRDDGTLCELDQGSIRIHERRPIHRRRDSDEADGRLRNDMDADGDPLAAVLGTGPANGTLTLNADGSFTYTPNADFYGTDTFTYRANDGALDSNLATVTITVTAVVDIAEDSPSTNEDNAVTVNVLSNDSFENAGRTVTAVSAASNGTVTILDGALGTVQYTPNADFNGSDSFTYTVTSGGVTETATVNITVNPVNDVPVVANLDGDTRGYAAGSGAVIVDQGTVATVTDVDSSDFNGGNLTVTITSGPVGAADLLGFSTVAGVSLAAGVTVGSTVSVGGILIGTITSDGAGE